MIRCLTSQFARAVAFSSIVALAACASEEAGPDAAAQSSGVGNQTSGTSTGGGSGQANTARISTNCQTPDGGKFHFRVGETVLALAPAEIAEAVPKGMKPPFTPPAIAAELDRQTSSGGGCPESPMDMQYLTIKANGGDTLLQGAINMQTSDPNLVREYADITSRLQANPPQRCQPMGADLLSCVGTLSAGEVKTPILLIVTTDRTKKMNSGGPLAVRCEFAEANVISGCYLLDLGAGGFIMNAVLKEPEYTTATLERAWRKANSEISTRIP